MSREWETAPHRRGVRPPFGSVIVATLALGIFSTSEGATLRLTATGPLYDALADSCGDDSTRLCTDLASLEVWGIRFRAPEDTVYFGIVPADGMEGLPIDIDAEIEAALAPMGELLVWSVDTSGNRSCDPAHYVWAFPDTTTGVAPKPGPGLLATFYWDVDLTNPAETRIDSVVNYTWGSGAGWSGGATDRWAARWQGTVTIPSTGDWTFYVASDDGCRLIVDGAVVQDDWRERWSESANTMPLTAGPHPIVLEYLEVAGGALCQLRWSGPGTIKALIPPGALSH